MRRIHVLEGRRAGSTAQSTKTYRWCTTCSSCAHACVVRKSHQRGGSGVSDGKVSCCGLPEPVEYSSLPAPNPRGGRSPTPLLMASVAGSTHASTRTAAVALIMIICVGGSRKQCESTERAVGDAIGLGDWWCTVRWVQIGWGWRRARQNLALLSCAQQCCGRAGARMGRKTSRAVAVSADTWGGGCLRRVLPTWARTGALVARSAPCCHCAPPLATPRSKRIVPWSAAPACLATLSGWRNFCARRQLQKKSPRHGCARRPRLHGLPGRARWARTRS